MLDPDLFELSPGMRMRMEPLADGIPVLLIDGIFREPERVRDQALNLQFEPPSDPYPGRIAVPDAANPSLGAFLTRTLDIVNRDYLPVLPRERAIGPLSRVHSDFAIVDRHPDELADLQRVPHVDRCRSSRSSISILTIGAGRCSSVGPAGPPPDLRPVI